MRKQTLEETVSKVLKKRSLNESSSMNLTQKNEVQNLINKMLTTIDEILNYELAEIYLIEDDYSDRSLGKIEELLSDGGGFIQKAYDEVKKLK